MTTPNQPGRHSLRFLREEVRKASSGMVAAGAMRDVLIVVDLQRDFFSGPMSARDPEKILAPLGEAIGLAEARGMLVVFTRDWHPSTHWSFKENGGPWMTHCVMNTPGAEIVPGMRMPPGGIVVNFGVNPAGLGYSPLENTALDLIVSNPLVNTVYVAGIALEYCVQATCHGLVDRGRRTVALEPAIAAASGDHERKEGVWRLLQERGVVRGRSLTALLEPPAARTLPAGGKESPCT